MIHTPGAAWREVVSSLRSALGRSFDYTISLPKSVFNEKDFRSVKNYAMFIGYPRSGHTLVGALLNAHPNIVIAHELDALKYARHGFTRSQIFSLILRSARRFSRRKSVWSGYSYRVPNQWQGRYPELRVIGDKKGGRSTLRCGEDPTLLRDFERNIESSIKLIHVVRNPYDNIATMHRRRQNGPRLEANVELYTRMCAINQELTRKTPAENLLELRLENLIIDPKQSLIRLCSYLGVSAPDGYVGACAGIVASSPRPTRHGIDWSRSCRDRVDRMITEFAHLEGYSFES